MDQLDSIGNCSVQEWNEEICRAVAEWMVSIDRRIRAVESKVGITPPNETDHLSPERIDHLKKGLFLCRLAHK